MKERQSNSSYYPAYYLPDTPRDLRDELLRRDEEDFRDWILGLNESYDIILDLHDLSWPKNMREHVHREVLGSGLHGYVTKEGHEAFIIKKEPNKEFADVTLSSICCPALITLLDSFKSGYTLPLNVGTIEKPLFSVPLATIEGGIEFLPYRVRKLRPLEFYTYPIDDGAELVLRLIRYLRSFDVNAQSHT